MSENLQSIQSFLFAIQSNRVVKCNKATNHIFMIIMFKYLENKVEPIDQYPFAFRGNIPRRSKPVKIVIEPGYESNENSIQWLSLYSFSMYLL